MKKYLLPFAGILLLLTLVFWKLGSNKSKMETNSAIANQKMTVFPVTIVSPGTEAISQNFSVSGDCKPAHELNFVSESSGRIIQIHVKNGDYVNKGQIIAQLDNEQVTIDLNLASANLLKAKTDLEKYQAMYESNAVNKQQVEDAKLTVVSTEARVYTLQRQLRVSTVLSPISGTINNLSLEVGSYLTPSSVIAEIIDISKLKMRVSVLDNQIVKLSKGQRVNIRANLYPNTPMEGNVSFVSSKADGSGKYEVEIELPNNSKNPLKAGMTGSASFELDGTKTATLIPLKCLVGSIQEPKVFVVNGNSVRIHKIAVGSIYEGKIEIVSGLSKSDKVVETGQANLTEGSKIQIIN